METLPVEVKAIICGFLPQQDAGTLRRVCKEFASIAARYSHKRLLVNISPAHINKIASIGNAPHLANHVHLLSIDCNALVAWRNQPYTWEDFKERYEVDIATVLGAPRLTENQLQNEFQNHKEFVASTKVLWKRLDTTLSSVFQHLPQLREIELGNKFAKQGAENPWQMRNAQEAIIEANRLVMPEPMTKTVRLAQVYKALVRSAGDLPANLEKITIEISTSAKPLLPLAPRIRQSLRTLDMRGLRKLGQNIDLPFLSYQNLENLTLTGCAVNLRSNNHFTTISLCHGPQMSSLKHVFLKTLRVGRKNLLKFLKLGKDTLELVKLENLKIDEKIWDHVYIRSRYEENIQVALILGAETIVVPQAPDSVVYRHWCRTDRTKPEQCLIKSLCKAYMALVDSDGVPRIDSAVADICKKRFCTNSPEFNLPFPEKG